MFKQLLMNPFFYGGDRYLGLIVIENVQHKDTLVEPLLGRDRIQAESALLQYATCLANLLSSSPPVLGDLGGD